MQRKTRLLLRAAKYLEREAREYAEHGRENADDSEWAGKRAGLLFASAYCLREIAASGYAPTGNDEKQAGFSALRHYHKLMSNRKINPAPRSATAFAVAKQPKTPPRE